MKTRNLIILVALLLPFSRGFAQDYEYPGLNSAMCMKTLKAWNDALNERDEMKLAELYDGVVNYYQTCLTNNQVRDSHARFFRKNAFYKQSYDSVTFDAYNPCQAEIRFNKHVQTEEDGHCTDYVAYLHLTLNDDNDGVIIIGESDETTDENLKKRQKTMVKVDNDTPLDKIFCEANVNKWLDVYYWDLVEYGEKEDGPLAKLLLSSDLARCSIEGFIKKDFKGHKGVYYCGGFISGGECGWPVIYIYNSITGQMGCVGGDEELERYYRERHY